MIKPLFLFILLASLTFSIVEAQCPELKEYCIKRACPGAGGETDDSGACIKNEDFDAQRYQENLEICDSSYDYCVENDGVVHNMSCFGPVLIFLSVILLALRADNVP